MSITPLLVAGPAIQIHVLGATLSLIGAIVMLLGRKGTPQHKFIGKLWVVSMGMTALSSFMIHEIRMIGDFSPIHLLSVLTLFGLYQIVNFARKGDIKNHQKAVYSLIYGALGVAGTFTFLPGRRMNMMFFGGDSMAGFTVVAAVVGGLWLWHRAKIRRVLVS